MESVVFTAVFVVLLCASGVLGQTGVTGQPCSTGNICNAVTDVCGVNNICRRKVDATCASPNQGNCVLGAQCDATNTCKCKTPYYIAGSGNDFGKCVPAPNYVGGSCSGTDKGTCLDVNAACTNFPNGLVCTCKGGYIWNTDSNTCATGMTGSTGMSCNSGSTCTATNTDVCGVNSFCRRRVDANCDIPYKYQCVLGATCDGTTPTCKCKTPYYMVGSGADSGKCVSAPNYVGGTCTGTGTCLDVNAACTNNVCTCKGGYIWSTDFNTCVSGPAGATGMSCSSGTCTATTTDVCGVKSICRRKVDANCAIPYKYQCVQGAQCDVATTTCKCKTPYYVLGTGANFGKCVPAPKYFGGSCMGTDRGTCLDANAACTIGICTCKTNYVGNTDTNNCVLIVATGQACSTSSPCTATTTDVCENSICKRRADVTCASPNQNQCVLNAQCDGTSVCKCRTGYAAIPTGTDFGKCGVPIVTGQACSTNSPCTATNTDVCENSICKRKADASCASPNQNQCVMNAQCEVTSYCRCKTGYEAVTTGTDAGKCVAPVNSLGGTCTGTNRGSCTDDNAVCVNSVCTCKTNYVKNNVSNTCNALSGATGQTCSSGNTCTASTTDICENNICKRKLDAPCISPNQFQCMVGTQCDSATATCKCRTPNYVTGTTGMNYGKCVPGTNYVGGSCTGPDRGTCVDVNAVCSNNVCTCKANYQRNSDFNICTGASGQTGTTGNVCYMGTTCNASSTDVCDNYLCKRRSGASCANPYQSQCVPGAECDGATMMCRCKTPRYVSGTFGSNLGKCLPGQNYLGGSCMGTGKGTCIDGNAECIQGVCTCKTSGLVTSDDNTCSGEGSDSFNMLLQRQVESLSSRDVDADTALAAIEQVLQLWRQHRANFTISNQHKQES